MRSLDSCDLVLYCLYVFISGEVPLVVQEGNHFDDSVDMFCVLTLVEFPPSLCKLCYCTEKFIITSEKLLHLYKYYTIYFYSSCLYIDSFYELHCHRRWRPITRIPTENLKEENMNRSKRCFPYPRRIRNHSPLIIIVFRQFSSDIECNLLSRPNVSCDRYDTL